ncbi:MAG TPA: substrate-binding domain-containing protein [Prosthecobacter sp.]|nr:substrate-binding domain-containing protein [Prosthecobacter sp.]
MNTKSPPLPALPQRLSLVAQTVQSLRDGIRAGHWQKHLPSERELCALLQVSRDTLRAALEEMQRKGWLEVTQRQRRRIKTRRSNHNAGSQKRVIAVLSPCSFLALSARMAAVMDALRSKLTDAGYAVEFHVSNACFSARPARALEKLVHDRMAAAWVVFGSKEPMQRWFIRHQLPCMVLGSCVPSIALPSLDVDYRAICRHAGGVLWRKGHRRLALVLSQIGYGGEVASEEGLRESLNDMTGAHLRVLRHDGTAAHLCALLDEAMRSPHPPTAFVVASTVQVLTVMMHLMRRGHRIPQDVAVISCSDDPFLQFTSPRIARYAINPTQFARRVAMASRQLAETGTLEPKAIRLMPKFLPGETV